MCTLSLYTFRLSSTFQSDFAKSLISVFVVKAEITAAAPVAAGAAASPGTSCPARPPASPSSPTRRRPASAPGTRRRPPPAAGRVLSRPSPAGHRARPPSTRPRRPEPERLRSGRRAAGTGRGAVAWRPLCYTAAGSFPSGMATRLLRSAGALFVGGPRRSIYGPAKANPPALSQCAGGRSETTLCRRAEVQGRRLKHRGHRGGGGGLLSGQTCRHFGHRHRTKPSGISVTCGMAAS